MQLKKKVESSLKKKGFEETGGDHRYFHYVTLDGITTEITTKTSRGTSTRDLGDSLIAAMARQTRLSKSEFVRLVECPLSRDDYEELLAAQGILDAPDDESSA